MRIISFFLFLSFFYSHAQTWQSIHKNQFGNTTPWNQFVINPYTNDIWMVNDNKAAVIQNNGSIELLNQTQLGVLWNGSDLEFAFTPTNVFYMKKTFGLFQFENSSNTLVWTEPNINKITSNDDTVYVLRMGTLLKYTNSSAFDSYFLCSDIAVKNTFLYTKTYYLGHQVGWMNSTLQTDSEYLNAAINDKKFQRNTDTLYVGTTKGIMYAYNYDILDTITPNNTSNMPSPNVLELEFDHLDQLWAVFGDTTDTPFAIAKLEGSTWTNFIDATNSPIDFSNFLGLEIDTLGNLWVADNLYLHTLMTATSPGWLGTTSLDPQSNLAILPNPAQNTFCISGGLYDGGIEIYDLQGRKILSSASGTDIDISQLNTGQYFVVIEQKTNKQVLVLMKE